MKLDSGKVVIWLTGVWLYVLLVLTLSEIVEVSFLLVALSYIPVVALYLFMLSKENKRLSSDELAARKPQGLIGLRQRAYTRRDFLDSFIAIFGAIILAFLTVFFVTRPDMTFQLTESIGISSTTCAKDASKIATLPVNKTVEQGGTKITVHSVTYNVPGQSEHPVEFPDKYHCAKATLVEVTIDRPTALNYKGSRSITLGHEGDGRGTPPRYYNVDDFRSYLDKNQLTILNDQDFTFKEDAYQQHGWLLFRLPDDYSNNGNVLTYEEHRYDTDGLSAAKSVAIALPDPRK